MEMERPRTPAETQSLCPVCLRRIPAEYVRRDGRVYMEKRCPEHGEQTVLVWEEGPDFFDWDPGVVRSRPRVANAETQRGCPYDCGLCGAHRQAACCVLIEITNRCNQRCPVCFASAGGSDAPPDYSLGEAEELFLSLRAKSPDQPFNIQLSGGEPTVHPELPAIIRLAKQTGFPYVQVNSNGLRIAQEPEYARILREAGADCLFLQFDGTSDAIYRAIRGEALLETKRRAIAHAEKAGLGVVLVVTVVPGVNDRDLGNIIDFAAEQLPQINGVHLQPVSYFGRYPNPPQNSDRITLPGLMARIAEQTEGAMQPEDFVPLASGHGRCSFHGNFLVNRERRGEYLGLSVDFGREVDHDIEKAKAYLARKWGSRGAQELSGLSGRGYAVEDWREFLRNLNDNTLSITAMAFQDAWSVDLERLSRCRLHVATRDQRIIPFCAYQMTNTAGEKLHP